MAAIGLVTSHHSQPTMQQVHCKPLLHLELMHQLVYRHLHQRAAGQQQQQQQQQQHTQQLASLVQQHFPTIDFGFAYGSGVFVQPDLYQPDAPAGSGPMLDFIFAVENPVAWHGQNMQLNPSHYSFLWRLGPDMACRVADRIGVGVYFNTLVPIGDQMVKYGVVGLSAFMQDLQHWSHLYVAGRLHKPVALLASQQEAEAAYHQNLRAALSTALLLLPKPESSLKDLFKRITSLSYLGDVRMGLAEDSKKVERIVAGSYSHFKDTYLPVLQEPHFKDLGVSADDEGLLQPQQTQQQQVEDSRVQLMSSLPSVLLSRMAAKLGTALQQQHAAAAAGVLAGAASGVSAQLPPLSAGARLDIAAAVLGSGRHRRLMKSALHAIVAGSSRRQAVAGLLYAGPVKSLQYLGRKLAKAWK